MRQVKYLTNCLFIEYLFQDQTELKCRLLNLIVVLRLQLGFNFPADRVLPVVHKKICEKPKRPLNIGCQIVQDKCHLLTSASRANTNKA